MTHSRCYVCFFPTLCQTRLRHILSYCLASMLSSSTVTSGSKPKGRQLQSYFLFPKCWGSNPAPPVHALPVLSHQAVHQTCCLLMLESLGSQAQARFPTSRPSVCMFLITPSRSVTQCQPHLTPDCSSFLSTSFLRSPPCPCEPLFKASDASKP